MRDSPASLDYSAALLVALAVGLVALLAVGPLPREIMQIAAVIAGAAFFSGLSLLLGRSRRRRTVPLIRIGFDGPRLEEKLSRIVDAEYTEVVVHLHFDPLDRETYADDDLVLALAKVRIDLERQVRRLARATGVMREDQRFDMRRTLEALERGEKLPGVAVIAIRDILPICNRAIHGEDIGVSDARNVIGIAREVMVMLEGELIKQATGR